MKTAVIRKFGKPEVFETLELPIPEIKNNQVLIKNFAAAINPIDFKSRQGKHKYILGSKFPIILGYDFAGVVEKTGYKVTNIKKGDKVFGRSDIRYGGTYAQYCISSANSMAIMPDELTFEEAAAIPLAALTALQALRDKCKIKKGQDVLLIGASGGVGHFALQLINFYQAKCYAVCSSNHKKFIDEFSPYKYIDYSKEDYKEVNNKYDIIFDAAGKENYVKCKHMLKTKGVYITTLPRPVILLHMFLSLFNRGKVKSLLMQAKHDDLNFVCDLVREQKLKPVIDSVFSLDQLNKAHEHAENSHTEGKIIIKIDHG